MDYHERIQRLAVAVASSVPFPDRAVALNLLYDYRAGQECLRAVCTLLAPTKPDYQQLREALEQYLDQVRANPALCFVHSGNQDDNAISVADDEYLAHLWNASAFLSYLDENDPAVADFVDAQRLNLNDRRDLFRWLDGIVTHPERLDALLALYNDYRHRDPRHPIWAAKWDDAVKIAHRKEPNQWLQALGLSSSVEKFLILFRYPAVAAKPLRRPTQFQAGWFALHFPSPPACAVDLGGFSLFAHDRIDPASLISEYIHAQIDWLPSHIVWARRSGIDSQGSLPDLRQRHYRRLQTHFPAQVTDWMEDPNEIPSKITLTLYPPGGTL